MSEKKEKFTPGPWIEGWNGGLTGHRCAFTVFLDGQGRRLDYRVISGQDKRLVCIIPDGEHAEGNEGNDAALIAAAPDMYAALEKAIADYGKPGGPWNVPSEPGTWIEMAQSALAKARGES